LALVLVAFGSHPNINRWQSSDAGNSGLTNVVGGEGAIQLFDGIFEAGLTPDFGPFTAIGPCWGTITALIPGK